jgi:hypothetical protein
MVGKVVSPKSIGILHRQDIDRNIRGVSAFLLLVIVFLLLLPACGQNAAAATPSPSPSNSQTPVNPLVPTAPVKPVVHSDPPAPSPTPAPKPTSTVRPNLTTVTFTMALATGQEYTEYTLPLYLKKDEQIHLNWVLTSGSDHLSFSFMTPDGETVIMRRDGTIVRNYPETYQDEKLFTMGNIIFRPADFGWREGYYIFRPHLRRGDAAVGAKILYWTEN